MPICGIPCSLSLSGHSPELFGSSRLLSQKWYVPVRTCLALNSLYWLVRSIRVFAETQADVKWLVYLTHWTYALQTLYYFLALASAAHLWANSGRKRRSGSSSKREGRRRDCSRPSDPEAGAQPPRLEAPSTPSKARERATDDKTRFVEALRKLQWGLFIVCADTSSIITAVYWAFLYNGWTDQLNLQLHLFNATFMAANVFMDACPFYWEHIGISYIYGFLYLLFDVLFYACGSAFGYNDNIIYYFLDWGDAPGRAVTFSLASLVVALPLAHGLNVLIARVREHLRKIRPDWGWQGTDDEELDRVMEVSGMRDADVWAPLTGSDVDLYDSEEDEMGGASVFAIGPNEEQKGVAAAVGT